MKKSYLIAKIVFGLTAGFLVTSCISDPESPVLTEQLEKSVALSEGTTGEENLRKSSEYNYIEKFSNQLSFVPGPEFAGGPAPAWYPGVGVGMVNRMGKAQSFINQFAYFDGELGLVTVGAPVTQFYSEELTNLGLTGIPSEVSSLTTDGKGNAIWFENVKNVTTVISADRTDFEAEVNVIGGNGRFSRAEGSGIVKGYFNPNTGVGQSELTARIDY